MEANKTAARITERGTYDVQIIDPRWEALEEKDGDANRMVAILPGWTDDDKMIEARLMFTRTIIGSGQNTGKPTWQVSAEKLHELGMPRPFDPSKLDELSGVRCVFVVEPEEYKNQTRLVVRFINTHRRDPMPSDQARNVWAALTGGAVVPAPATAPKQAVTRPASAEASKDDLPW